VLLLLAIALLLPRAPPPAATHLADGDVLPSGAVGDAMEWILGSSWLPSRVARGRRGHPSPSATRTRRPLTLIPDFGVDRAPTPVPVVLRRLLRPLPT
jgi:hypothetical protein